MHTGGDVLWNGGVPEWGALLCSGLGGGGLTAGHTGRQAADTYRSLLPHLQVSPSQLGIQADRQQTLTALYYLIYR